MNKKKRDKLNSMPPQAPVKVNNYFTCKPTCIKSTNAPMPMAPREVEPIKSIVNAEIATPSKVGKVDIHEVNKFVPTIDVSATKGTKKKK